MYNTELSKRLMLREPKFPRQDPKFPGIDYILWREFLDQEQMIT